MRYVVMFSHRQYLQIQEALLAAPDEYRIPEGLYRQVCVVVEAASEREATRKAAAELGWPHEETHLVPMGVASQDDVVRDLKMKVHPIHH